MEINIKFGIRELKIKAEQDKDDKNFYMVKVPVYGEFGIESWLEMDYVECDNKNLAKLAIKILESVKEYYDE